MVKKLRRKPRAHRFGKSGDKRPEDNIRLVVGESWACPERQIRTAPVREDRQLPLDSGPEQKEQREGGDGSLRCRKKWGKQPEELSTSAGRSIDEVSLYRDRIKPSHEAEKTAGNTSNRDGRGNFKCEPQGRKLAILWIFNAPHQRSHSHADRGKHYCHHRQPAADNFHTHAAHPQALNFFHDKGRVGPNLLDRSAVGTGWIAFHLTV